MIVRIRILRNGKVGEYDWSLFIVDGRDDLKEIFMLIKSGKILIFVYFDICLF